MKKLYSLTASQDVVRLQCKYTLFKRVVNIISSVKTKKDLDFKLLEKSFNLLVERNDCLRIRFVKYKGQLKQYFEEKVDYYNVPILEFKTENEQEKFLDKLRKKAIKYQKGVVIEPYFIKTFDGKNMILFKVCHLILDMYGLNMIYKDFLEIYKSLSEDKPLPKKLEDFEKVVIKEEENNRKEDTYKKDLEFFKNILDSNEEPYYAGIQPQDEPIWKKQMKKGKRAMKMFFIQNDTFGYEHKIDREILQKVEKFATDNKMSLPNIYFYAMALCSAKINNLKNILPLQLCNCRGNALDKNTAGTKVQSVGTYLHIDYDKTFMESIEEFNKYNFTLFRHLSFPDQDFEMLLHKTYGSSMLETYYHLTFSFIPFVMPKDFEFNMYSNKKCALPCYIGLMYDFENGSAIVNYDVQTKIISENDVATFHKRYMKLLNEIAENPNIKIKELNI